MISQDVEKLSTVIIIPDGLQRKRSGFNFNPVMAGLGPAIHVFVRCHGKKGVDHRNKASDDDNGASGMTEIAATFRYLRYASRPSPSN